MITSAAPNTSTRYCSNPRNRSGSQAMRNAPRMTPSRLPEPPSTTAHRISADRMNGKLSGVIEVVWAAKMAPARPPTEAPMTNETILNRNVGTPISSAASSSSRIAAQDRPTRLFSSRFTMMITRMIDDHQKVVVGPGVEHAVAQDLDAADLARSASTAGAGSARCRAGRRCS